MSTEVTPPRLLRARQRWRRVALASRVLEVAAFLVFTAFALSSVDFDFDQFVTAAEVDRRSWLLEHAPPT